MRKFVAYTLLLVTLLVVVAPPVLYFYSTRGVGLVPPNKSDITLSQSAVNVAWQEAEKCTPEECSRITPYWLYGFLVLALISDNVKALNIEYVKGNLSVMSGAIALDWMRSNSSRPKGMGMWHLTSISLSIYIQRNWSASEIVSKYQAIYA